MQFNLENYKLNILKKVSFIFLGSLIFNILMSSCKKLIEIDPPKNTITTEEAFKDSINAASSIAGIYSKLFNQTVQAVNSFGGGAITLNAGVSSDELATVFSSDPFFANALTPVSNGLGNFFWTQPYAVIYETNAAIEALQASKGMSVNVKNQFVGEAKFIRAFCYFYLINLYGDVPLITSIDYRSTALASRSSVAQVYNLIMSDLKDAQALLPNDYSYSNNERIRATKWAATALLSRVYLFNQKWSDAETQATSILNNTATFNLVQDLNSIFLANSDEAILQWQNNTKYTPYNVIPEGALLLPLPSRSPSYYLSNQLISAFEAGDLRKSSWIYKFTFRGKTYPLPYKYKLGTPQKDPNNAVAPEYYMVLRLAEQYLIRAEARAQLNNLSGAVSDIDMIRQRAGLPLIANTNPGINQTALLNTIAHERQVELFAEWGHRWFDLKRTGTIDAVMSAATPLKNTGTTWHSFQKLYPIPFSEIQAGPNLTQNPGY